MSLHRELLAVIADFEGLSMTAAVRAVVELHAPDHVWHCCNHEGASVDYPCETIQAIARELSIQTGDTR